MMFSKLHALSANGLILLMLAIIALVLSASRNGFATANVINDVNNMLRDVAAETEAKANSHIGQHVNVGRAEAKMLQNQIKSISTESYGEDTTNMEQDAAEAKASSVELLRFVNDNETEDNDADGQNDDDDDDDDIITGSVVKTLLRNNKDGSTATTAKEEDGTLNEQVRLLSKQLNALMMRRREDYELLEHNLRKSLQLKSNAENVDLDIRTELDQLRLVNALLDCCHVGGKKNLKSFLE